MIDETAAGSGGQSGAPEDRARENEAAKGRVGFCQQCGRELTAETIRRAGSAVYCEPCLVARLGTAEAGRAPGYTPVNNAGGPAYTAPPVNPDSPNPGLAALLGLIPGVGAMYNGQFAKGVAHLVIFAILVSLSDNVNGIFGLFVAGWVFHQSFEAYHTAKARRDGLPLPNAFGLNDVGDRVGFGKNWPGSASRPVTSAQNTNWTSTTTPPPPAAAASANWNPNWAGYVPPTGFGATAPPPPPTSPESPGAASTTAGTAYAQQPPASGWTPGSYDPGYAGQSWAAAPSTPVVPLRPVRRFPVGAMWLIGLGLLFLLSNVAPGWRIVTGHWLVPIVLAALAIWLLFQRVELARRMAEATGETSSFGPETGRRLACQIRWPIMLLVLALLFALQAAHLLTLGQTWPVLFIALGALLVLERTVGRGGLYPPVGMAGATDYNRANWTAGQTAPQKDGK